ncbi:MAG: hypothetical protein KDH92_00785 [Chloroflexi bacterium]|nr:hypothetical protein [Chloroflexota bacterium]
MGMLHGTTRRRHRGILSLGALAMLVASSLVIAAPGPKAAAQSLSPESTCGTGGWRRLAGVGDASQIYALAASGTRLYASGLAAGGGYATWSTALNAGEGLKPIGGALAGRRVSALMVQDDDPNWLAWAAGFGDDGVFAAAPSSPLSFGQRGSLDAWPMQLMAARGQVFAAFARADAAGIYAWDGSAWTLAGGTEIPPVSTGALAFWSSARGNGRLWLGTEARGLWSADEQRAAEWTWVGDAELRASTVTALAVDPLVPTRMAAGLGPSLDGRSTYLGLRRSSDGGQTWSAPAFAADPLRGPEYLAALSYSRVLSGTLVAAAYGHGLHVSRDGGQRWQRLLPPSDPQGGNAPAIHENYLSALTTALPPDRPGCELLFAAGRGGVWVRDLATLPSDGQIFLPWANQARSAGVPLSRENRALPAAPNGPTPMAPSLALPQP